MCEDSGWRILREVIICHLRRGKGGGGWHFDEFGRVITKIFPDPPKAL